MIVDHAIHTRKFQPTHQRQDRAKCLECDWSFGWDLGFETVDRYASEHRETTGHPLDYRTEFITRREHHYVIGGK
jgi:hypothetical protein